MLTLQESIKHLEQKGYRKHFIIKNGELFNGEDKLLVSSESMQVDEIYRIDEDSGGAEQSIIYAISCKNKISTKGLLISGHGRFTNPEDLTVLNKLDDCHQKN